MVELEWTLREQEGVCLVELRVANPTKTAVRVRIANELPAPLWPPRSAGLPVSGWDDGGWEGLIAAGTAVALGYAAPAPSVEPPATVVLEERTESTAETAYDSPSAVVQALGDATPPRDAVPVEGATDPTEQRQPNEPHASEAPSPPERAGQQSPPVSLPPAVSEWLSAVERDVARAERLTAVETVPDATAAVASVGGLDEVRQLAETTAETKRVLHSLSKATAALETRLDETTIPVETLVALA
ncbi:DUF7857 domain-containing protein [Haladaptatus sp. CMSO5]|uniref:DUF7857 domain-containing protein n=1 Tax=Haladaptatus sp. CMSO5 TaxID=3120514 RepID=UPI002FCE01AB